MEDATAAANLLGRAPSRCSPQAPRRTRLLPDLGWALTEAGEFQQAAEVLDEAVDAAQRSGDERTWAAAVCARFHDGYLTGAVTSDDMEEFRVAIGVLRRDGEHGWAADALRIFAAACGDSGRWAETRDAYERPPSRLARPGDRTKELAAVVGRLQLGFQVVLSPRCRSCGGSWRHCCCEPDVGPTHRHRVLRMLALCRAADGDIDEARALLDEERRLVEELGSKLWPGIRCQTSGDVEMLAGDHEAAEREYRAGYDYLGELDEQRVPIDPRRPARPGPVRPGPLHGGSHLHPGRARDLGARRLHLAAAVAGRPRPRAGLARRHRSRRATRPRGRRAHG